ncbi:hypothetical protein ABK040_002546 [Willaertia magna]
MNVTVRGLLERSFVERFSWFAPINPTDPIMGFSALFEVDGSLTSVGKFYASLGVSENNIVIVTSGKVVGSSSTKTNEGGKIEWKVIIMLIMPLILFIVLTLI